MAEILRALVDVNFIFSVPFESGVVTANGVDGMSKTELKHCRPQRCTLLSYHGRAELF